MNDEIKSILKFRILKRIEKFDRTLYTILGQEGFKLIIAGNSMNKNTPNDFDLYADKGFEFDFEKIKKFVEENDCCEYVTETRNALTVKVNDITLQFCKYQKDDLKTLVDSFDFAHIQVGALFEATNGYLKLTDVYYSENWEKAKMLETTFYTKPDLKGSYPLSSLIRCFKYKERGDFGDRSYIVSVLDILNQIISRGYKNYDDFKDQMEAVDLQLLEEDESNSAWKLYGTLVNSNLVNEPEEEE